MSWFVIGLIGCLLIIYMAKPRTQNRDLSQARFFNDLPRPRQKDARLRLARPGLTRTFFLQGLVLLLLLAALLVPGMNRTESIEAKTQGLWLLLDNSGSMSTRQQGETRLAVARREAHRFIEAAEGKAGQAPCYRLSSFHMIKRDLVKATTDSALITAQLSAIKVEPLATDLGLIKSLLQGLATLTETEEGECAFTHLVVITDQPAPEWLKESVIWRDVGRPVDNMGFTSISAETDPLLGSVQGLDVEITSYGDPPANARLRLLGPTGRELTARTLSWPADGVWRDRLPTGSPGRYQLLLEPGGAYAFDDQATVQISGENHIRVAWQLSDHGLLEIMGWSQDTTSPHFRVASRSNGEDAVPTLIVGRGFGPKSSQDTEIRDFLENSALLSDLNLDAVESLGMSGLQDKAGFQPVLRGTDDAWWLASRHDPPAAFVPGLPTLAADVTGRVSATMFFNAVRWLLAKRPKPVLYNLTSPAASSIEGIRIALHEGEGNTSRPTRSHGDVGDLKPLPGKTKSGESWILWLVAALIIFALERIMALLEGGRWR